MPAILAGQQSLAQQSGESSFAASQQVLQEQRPSPGNDSQEEIESAALKKDRAQEKRDAALSDPFLQSIEATSGPAAAYKENRLSGAYKKVCLVSLLEVLHMVVSELGRAMQSL